jgi:hypothetical protein
MSSVTTIFTLSDLSQDFDQFVVQFQTQLQNSPTWVGNLTTQTSETLIEYISTVGTFAQGRITRTYEDAFAETAQSDDAILSIAQMQGLRLSRYLPAQMTCVLNSTITVSLAPLTQFQCAGSYFYNNEAITIVSGTPLNTTLYEGQVYFNAMNGLGTERQLWVSQQDDFVISDQDVYVQINGQFIPKSYGNLWNYDGQPAYSDSTLSDGRLVIQWGNLGGVNGQFGTIPQVNDLVIVSYPVTLGANGNSLQTAGSSITAQGFVTITGTSSENPSGGANQTPIIAYKNVASGAFGTYSSAVTKSQYQALIATFPGIVDAVTQAQREIDPGDVRWMNVVRVSALTTSPWSQAQITEFLNYCQSVTMYAVYFLWQEAIAVPNAVDVDVYIYNSAIPTQVQSAATTAITNLFAPRPGILMTNFYLSDIEQVIFNSNPGLIDYVNINAPGGPMIVTSPTSPQITYTIDPGAGTLGPGVYSYSVSTTLTTGAVGFPTTWAFPQIISGTNNAITLTWPAIFQAASYEVWGRSAEGTLGLIATVTSPTVTFVDTGSITPVGPLPNSSGFPIQYNSLSSLTVNVFYSARQQVNPGSDPTRLLGGS